MDDKKDIVLEEKNLLKVLRDGGKLSGMQLIKLIFQLSLPGIFAQLSTIVMEYIDASMVGHIGANGSAAIGLVSSSTWLFGGLSSALCTGFTVQVAQLIGANDSKKAREVVKNGLMFGVVFAFILGLTGVLLSGKLPGWLGGDIEIQRDASLYFMVYSMAIPISLLNRVAGGMLQGSGNMKVPSALHILMCFLDVLFNSILIFESRDISIFGLNIHVFGFGLSVMGAALGTALAELVTAVVMLYFLLVKSEELHIRKNEGFKFSGDIIKNALKIGIPVGVEQIIMCSAYVASTLIVAPLGTISVAAHSLSVTAESLCYMPGYGIGSAATTLIGQSIGAGRKDLTRKLGFLITFLGMAVMTITGVLMYIFAPEMIGSLSPDPAVRELGTIILRIEAFAEPFYAASIVASGVFKGARDTLIPSCMNFCSMWIVRLPLSFVLAKTLGLKGVWIAMCIDLIFRGTIFLIKLCFFQRNKKEQNKIQGAD